MGAPRTLDFDKRCEIARLRVSDWLVAHGGSNSQKGWDDAKVLFVRRAIRVARERNLRMWKSENMEMEQLALSSLRLLLQERSVPDSRVKGKRHTGRNLTWVLCIWEAVLDQERGKDPAPSPQATAREVSLAEPARDVGVEAFASERGKLSRLIPQDAGMRLIEAYTRRDDAVIMDLALLLDTLDKREVELRAEASEKRT